MSKKNRNFEKAITEAPVKEVAEEVVEEITPAVENTVVEEAPVEEVVKEVTPVVEDTVVEDVPIREVVEKVVEEVTPVVEEEPVEEVAEEVVKSTGDTYIVTIKSHPLKVKIVTNKLDKAGIKYEIIDPKSAVILMNDRFDNRNDAVKLKKEIIKLGLKPVISIV